MYETAYEFGMDVESLGLRSLALIEDIALWHARQQARDLAETIEETLKHSDSHMLRAMLDFTRSLERDLLQLEDKAGYNPSQPRVPAGSPNGGQWTSGGGGSLAEAPDYLRTWADATRLESHVRRHGKDFGAISANDYTEKANVFYERYKAEKLPAVVDKNGVIRVYDPSSNTFGSYNADGTTRSFYKPRDGLQYFQRETNRYVNNGGSMINKIPTTVGPELPRGGGGRGGGLGRIDDDLIAKPALSRRIQE